MLAAVLGATMTTWVTFAPSFLFIFAGAPFVEDLRHNRLLAGALKGITAAVVGVILYLAIWFALHVFFGRVGSLSLGPLSLPTFDPWALDWKAAALAATAFFLAFRVKLGLLPLIGTMAALGVAVKLGPG
jgi:chromate transporter